MQGFAEKCKAFICDNCARDENERGIRSCAECETWYCESHREDYCNRCGDYVCVDCYNKAKDKLDCEICGHTYCKRGCYGAQSCGIWPQVLSLQMQGMLV